MFFFPRLHIYGGSFSFFFGQPLFHLFINIEGYFFFYLLVFHCQIPLGEICMRRLFSSGDFKRRNLFESM